MGQRFSRCFSWCLRILQPRPEPREPQGTLRRSANYQRLTKSELPRQHHAVHARPTAPQHRSYAKGYGSGETTESLAPSLPAAHQSGTPHLENVSIEGGKPTGERWYHGDISHNKAKYRLNEGDKKGTFLVYDNPDKTGEYLLLVLVIKHAFGQNRGQREHHCWRISSLQGSKWVVGEPPFVTNHASVHDLVKHHMKKPLLLENGEKVKLGDHVYMPD